MAPVLAISSKLISRQAGHSYRLFRPELFHYHKNLSPIELTHKGANQAAVRRGYWPQIYFGVAATSLATLILELALTRVFSVIYFYHFAFLAISIALFGLGTGGVLSYVVAAWPWPLFRKVAALAILNAGAIVVCLSWLLGHSGNMQSLDLVLAYFVAAVPFILSGTIISLLIADTIAQVDRIYFFDLAGAAAGCAALVPLLNWIGGPNTILVASVLFAVSAAIWFHLAGSSQGRVSGVVLGLGLVALITANAKYSFIDVKFAKGQAINGELFQQWNSFSRIGLKREGSMKSIVIDADAATGVANFDFDRLSPAERHTLAYDGPGFPYLLRPGAKTLIIGPGGGWDVSRALASGSKQITGVEINPIIANVIMRRKFPQFSRRLYFRPEVNIAVEDGRSFVRRSPEKYQVLQATLVDTWASTAAGAFALSENNLYTTEAFIDYLQHLTPDGLLAFTRWGFVPPRESLRVVSLAITALQKLGVHDPASHVIVIREDVQNLQAWGAKDTILIARSSFTRNDVQTLRAAIPQSKLEAVYYPGTNVESPFRELLLSQDRAAFYRSYSFDVRPVSDNRPFFFYTVQPHDLWAYFFRGFSGAADYKINTALPVLFGVVAISILATVVMLALPPFLLGTKLPRTSGSFTALLYFLCIGTGYILIQVALIQKFVLFLGHPTYALTVIIFSMLLSSGTGSFFSKRLLEGDTSRLRYVLLFVFASICLLALIVSPIASGGVALRFGWKVVITVLLISPVGFAMGLPFPTGLSILQNVMPASVRWAWSINAASSVMGSAGAMFLAIYLGLEWTLMIGGIFYLAALASFIGSAIGRRNPSVVRATAAVH